MGGIAYVPKHEYEAMKAEIERLRAALRTIKGLRMSNIAATPYYKQIREIAGNVLNDEQAEGSNG